MKEKLRRCGIRSIDAVVDVTNYVLELASRCTLSIKIALKRIIGWRKRVKTLVLLTVLKQKLNAGTLVIADTANKALAMGGIFGGGTLWRER